MERKGMTVITYGTFDLFHIGHLRLLERAKKLAGDGGQLIVAVSTDRFNWEEKKKKSVICDQDRMEIVGALRCVDKVIPEDNWAQKESDVEKYGVDIFVMGDDWKGKFDFLKSKCQVVYLPRTSGVSSTDLKSSMGKEESSYGQYRQSGILRIKNGVRKFLKSARVGKRIYQVCQKIWRAYAIPKRQKRLQREGAQALERLHRLMQKNHIPYYCDYGTLIGFVRDNGFIKHDDDIDITIQPNTVKAVDVLKVFLDAGYGYVHGFKYESKFLEFTVADVSGITIDVFFPDLLGDGKVQAYQPIWEPGKKYPSENANTLIQYVFEEATGLKTIQVVGTATTIPGNYDQVLTSEYGPWKVPDAKFNTVTDRVHKEMPGFAYRMTQEEALSFV